MSDKLNQTTVLVLNRNWQAINIRTPADAICQMATGVATALEIVLGALPYADVFITDNGKATAIRELKLDRAYKTQVFSIKKFELAALAAKLREIVN